MHSDLEPEIELSIALPTANIASPFGFDFPAKKARNLSGRMRNKFDEEVEDYFNFVDNSDVFDNTIEFWNKYSSVIFLFKNYLFNYFRSFPNWHQLQNLSWLFQHHQPRLKDCFRRSPSIAAVINQIRERFI